MELSIPQRLFDQITSDGEAAAHIVGYFDTIDQMHAVYNRYKGHTALSVDQSGWRLVP